MSWGGSCGYCGNVVRNPCTSKGEAYDCANCPDRASQLDFDEDKVAEWLADRTEKTASLMNQPGRKPWVTNFDRRAVKRVVKLLKAGKL